MSVECTPPVPPPSHGVEQIIPYVAGKSLETPFIARECGENTKLREGQGRVRPRQDRTRRHRDRNAAAHLENSKQARRDHGEGDVGEKPLLASIPEWMCSGRTTGEVRRGWRL